MRLSIFKKAYFIGLFLLLDSVNAQELNISGQVVRPNGVPLTKSMSLTVQVYSSNGGLQNAYGFAHIELPAGSVSVSYSLSMLVLQNATYREANSQYAILESCGNIMD